jgi:sugar phosphate isomerase/epimerase
MFTLHPTRRDLLKLGGAAAASMVVADALGVTLAAYKKIPIGTQAWCVRKQLATDIPGTLKGVRAAGFEAIELENRFGKSGAEWKQQLDAADLKACGFHHTVAELSGDKLAETIEFNKAIGNGNLIIRSFPPAVYTSAELTKKTADTVNEIAAKVKPHRMRVGYHNHTTDFNRIDGDFWWNKFADWTTKDVILQFDTGNASENEGGVPIVDLIKRNAGRTASMHIKPFSKTDKSAYIGKDQLDWPAIMSAAESTGGVEWYIIEYELEQVPPLESLKANLDNFKKLRA